MRTKWQSYLVGARIQSDNMQLLFGTPNKKAWYSDKITDTKVILSVFRGLNIPYTEYHVANLISLKDVMDTHDIITFVFVKTPKYSRPWVKFSSFEEIKGYPLDKDQVYWEAPKVSNKMTVSTANKLLKLYGIDGCIINAKTYQSLSEIPYGYIPVLPFIDKPDCVEAIKTIYDGNKIYQKIDVIRESFISQDNIDLMIKKVLEKIKEVSSPVITGESGMQPSDTRQQFHYTASELSTPDPEMAYQSESLR